MYSTIFHVDYIRIGDRFLFILVKKLLDVCLDVGFSRVGFGRYVVVCLDLEFFLLGQGDFVYVYF